MGDRRSPQMASKTRRMSSQSLHSQQNPRPDPEQIISLENRFPENSYHFVTHFAL